MTIALKRYAEFALVLCARLIMALFWLTAAIGAVVAALILYFAVPTAIVFLLIIVMTGP